MPGLLRMEGLVDSEQNLDFGSTVEGYFVGFDECKTVKVLDRNTEDSEDSE